MPPTKHVRPAGRRRWVSIAVSVAISVACMTVVLHGTDRQGLRHAAARLDAGVLAAGLAYLAIGYAVRIFRWSLLLRFAGAPVAPLACAAPFLGSIALNNVTPLRGGDVIRALVFPVAMGVDRVTATVTLVLERVVDTLAVLACVLLGLATLHGKALPPWISTSMLAMGGAVALAIAMLALVMMVTTSSSLNLPTI